MPDGSGIYLIQVWRARPERPVLGLQGERGVGIEDEGGRKGEDAGWGTQIVFAVALCNSFK